MRLYVELLDIVQHAKPNLLGISTDETVPVLNARDGAFMSYDLAFRDCEKMPSGLITEKLLEKQRYDKRDWVQGTVLEVAKALNTYVPANCARWINVNRKPIAIGSNRLWVKPSIRGIAITTDRDVCPVMVVTRRSLSGMIQPSLPFLMRGGYELHIRDDPNFTDFLVIDVSEGARGSARKVSAYKLSQHDMMPLEEFDYILQTYFRAASLSKYGVFVPSNVHVRDLFKR